MALIAIGMAGSGKTTFVNNLKNYYLQKQESRYIPYIVNLDPAVTFVPYVPDFDIRNFYNQKDVMEKFKLGPNGAIMTCLNLFSAKITELTSYIEKALQLNPDQLFLVDTPGQIEAFNWSASGQIIAKALSNTLPTAVLFVADKVRCQNPNAFMSTMLFGVSVLFRVRLPLLMVFNKFDIAVDDAKCIEWLKDYDSFLSDLKQESEGYINSLSRSLCLALDKFYKDLPHIAVSSLTGLNIDQLPAIFDTLRKDYSELCSSVEDAEGPEDH